MKNLVFLSIISFLSVFAMNSSHAQTRLSQQIEEESLQKESCDAGNVQGCYMLSRIYLKSKSPTRKAKGKKLLAESCQKGETSACEDLRGGILANKGSDILYYGSIFLIGFAVFLVTRLMFQEEDEFKAQEKLDDDVEKDDLSSFGPILKYSRPFFRRYVSPIVSSMKSKKKIREKYKRALASSGLNQVLTAEDFVSFKLFLILGFPIVFLFVRWFLEETWSLSLVPMIAVIGFFYPDIWIRGLIQKRQKEIILNMPFSVDMLALSVEAGLDFIAAMQKVVEKAKDSALTQEFETLMKEIKIGSSRAEALRNMAWRVDLIQITSFCATLIAADSVGASIGPILKSLSGEIRQKRSSDAEKAGATAATKILFPMMFLITPAVFIIVMAPIALEFLNGGN